MPSEYELNLDGSYQGLPIRGENRFLQRSALKWNLIKDDHGVAPESIYPNRYLPVLAVDRSTDDGISIPQGVIVSLVNVYKKDLYATIGADTEAGISASGTISAGIDAFGGVITLSVSDEKNAYGDYQNSVLTIANGGDASQDIYTALDVYTSKTNAAGALVVADDVTTRAANIPFGITQSSVFDDYRGKYLNSDGTQLELHGPLIDSYISIPYIIDDAANTLYYTPVVTTDGSNIKTNVSAPTTHKGYNAALPLCGFLYMGARTGVAAAAVEDAFAMGEYLVSDQNGRFVPQASTTSNALTQTKSAQTIGRLISLDHKWPKDLQSLVDTYEGSGMTGTDTNGISKFLYDFVAAVLAGSALAYTRDLVLAAINSGRFGMATIEILAA